MIDLFFPVLPKRGIAKVYSLECPMVAARKRYERDWYLKNRERRLADMKARYEANKSEYVQKARQWAADNPEKARLIKRNSKLRRRVRQARLAELKKALA